MQAIRSALRGPRHRDAASESASPTAPSGVRMNQRRLGATLLLCAAIAVSVTSCGDDPPAASPGDGSPVTSTVDGAGTTAATVAPPPDPEPTPPEPEPTPPDPEPTPPDPEPAAPGPRQEIDVDGTTTWQEAFDTFTPSEQSCIREALGDEVLGSLLEERVTESELADGEWSLFPCLEPEIAESVMFAALIWSIEDEEQLELGDEERACLRDLVAGIDWNELATAGDDPAPISALVTGTLNCVPDVLLGGMLSDMGVDLEELSDDERACLRDWITGIDWTQLTTDDEAAALALAGGMIGCVPDLLLANMLGEMGVDTEELSDDERACLRDLVAGIDWTGMTTEGEDFAAFAELVTGFAGCIGDPFGAGPAPETPDDHADTAAGATPATAGEPIGGVVDYYGDLDFFAFEAEQGLTYEIDVTLGTLDDSTVALYTADAEFLAYNDDTDDSLASHITWLAPNSGEHLVEVGGYGTGSYTLTITASDSQADTAGGATATAG